MDGLEDTISHTANGELVSRAFQIEADGAWGFKLDLEEISAREYSALKIVKMERDRYQIEQIKKQQQHAE